MPVIDVKLIEGRTEEQRRALCEALTEATMKALGVGESSVTVILHDVPAHSWMSAGKLASASRRS